MAGRTAIGLIITLAWLAIAALYVHETRLGFPALELNDLGDLFIDYSNELTFFWLVLGYIWLVIGYFQQRAELRQNWRVILKTAEHAETATHKLELESQKFEDYQQSRVRAAQPRWEVQGCIAHKEQHEINIRNVGAPASSLRAVWDRELPIAVVLSNVTVVDRGQQLTIKVVFRGARLEKFDLILEYCDALGEPRRAYIAVAETTVTIQNHG
jgi:hypothetical protein